MPPSLVSCRIAKFCALAFAVAFLCTNAQPVLAQRVTVDLPDAPVPKQQPGGAEKKNSGGFSSTVDVLSRRSLFFPDLAASAKPLSGFQKFELAVDQSIAPSAWLGAAFTAGIEQADNSWPGFGQGGEGYAKRFGATMAVNASTDMFGTFLLPAIAHHDPRYFVSNGGFGRKIGHAIRRVLLTRTDSGGETANWSGLLGILGAEGLANTYLPDAEQTTSKTFQRFGIHVGVTAGGNLAREFWPVIFKSLLGGNRGARAARQSDLKDSSAKP